MSDRRSFTRSDQVTQKSDSQALWALYKLSKGQRLNIASGLVLILLSNVSMALGAYFVSKLIEEGLRKSDFDRAMSFGLIVLSFEVGMIFLFYFGRRILSYSTLDTILTIRETLFLKLEKLPMSFFDREPVGRTVTRLTHDVENLENFFTSSMPRLVSATLSVTTVSVAMLVTNLELGLWLFVSIIPAVLFTVGFRKPVRRLNREWSSRNSLINSRLNEFLNGIPVIRAFGLEDWSKRRFDHEANAFLQSGMRINQFNSWLRPSVSLFAAFPLIMLVLVGVPSVLSGAITLGLFVTFLRYSERFYRPIYIISQEIHQVQNAFAYLERVLSLYQEDEEEKSLGAATRTPPPGPWEMEFKNCSIRYPLSKDWTLENFNLKIPAKSKLGIVGRTGSGKTTIVSMLARLYPFQEGDILINGQSITTFDKNSLRAHLAFVSQDVVIFEGRLRDNLAFGRPFSDEEIIEACEKSGFIECMRRNALGLESMLLDRGENLSVGERQLLSIARIFLQKPSLIVMDEATANIDESVEALVQEALGKLSEESTCIVIAHRLKTLDLCDDIVVLSYGKVIEHGARQELIKQRGAYYQYLNQ